MSSLLSKPVFVAGPDDSLASADLYKATGKLINELRDISDVFNASSLDALKGGNKLLDEIKNTLIKDYQAGLMGIKLDADSLMKGLISVNTGMMSALRSLPSGIQTELTKVNGFSEITGTLGGIVSHITKANLSTVNGLATMINGISGANLPFNFTDKNGLAQLSASLIVQASKVGIKGALDPFINTITDKVVLKNIVKNVANEAINNNMTSLLYDVARSNQGKLLSKTMTGIGLRILKKYKNNNNFSLYERYNKYKQTCESLDYLDDGWMNYQRSGGDVVEGLYVQNASDDFIKDTELFATWHSSEYDIPSNISDINTSIYTPTQAYLGLITPDLESDAKSSLKESMKYVMFT